VVNSLDKNDLALDKNDLALDKKFSVMSWILSHGPQCLYVQFLSSMPVCPVFILNACMSSFYPQCLYVQFLSAMPVCPVFILDFFKFHV